MIFHVINIISLLLGVTSAAVSTNFYLIATDSAIDWYTAKISCVKTGGVLAAVSSVGEIDQVKNLVTQGASVGAWIGAIGNGRLWVWGSTDFSAVSTFRWTSTQNTPDLGSCAAHVGNAWVVRNCATTSFAAVCMQKFEFYVPSSSLTVSWSTSLRSCADDNAVLAVLKTSEDLAAARQALKDYGAIFGWIALHSLAEKWVWSSYSNLAADLPIPWSQEGLPGQCAVISEALYFGKDCSSTYKPICMRRMVNSTRSFFSPSGIDTWYNTISNCVDNEGVPADVRSKEELLLLQGNSVAANIESIWLGAKWNSPANDWLWALVDNSPLINAGSWTLQTKQDEYCVAQGKTGWATKPCSGTNLPVYCVYNGPNKYRVYYQSSNVAVFDGAASTCQSGKLAVMKTQIEQNVGKRIVGSNNTGSMWLALTYNQTLNNWVWSKGDLTVAIRTWFPNAGPFSAGSRAVQTATNWEANSDQNKKLYSLCMEDTLFFVTPSKQTWDKSKLACINLGGYLATVLTDDEDSMARSLAGSNENSLWIGAGVSNNSYAWGSADFSQVPASRFLSLPKLAAGNCAHATATGWDGDAACSLSKKALCKVGPPTFYDPFQPKQVSSTSAPTTTTKSEFENKTHPSGGDEYFEGTCYGEIGVSGFIDLPDGTIIDTSVNDWERNLSDYKSRTFQQTCSIFEKLVRQSYNGSGAIVFNVTCRGFKKGSIIADYVVALRSLTQLTEEQIKAAVLRKFGDMKVNGSYGRMLLTNASVKSVSWNNPPTTTRRNAVATMKSENAANSVKSLFLMIIATVLLNLSI